MSEVKVHIFEDLDKLDYFGELCWICKAEPVHYSLVWTTKEEDGGEGEPFYHLALGEKCKDALVESIGGIVKERNRTREHIQALRRLSR